MGLRYVKQKQSNLITPSVNIEEIQVQELHINEVDDALLKSLSEAFISFPDIGGVWSSIEETGIVKLYLARNKDNKIIGFQAVDRDGLCAFIEVAKEFRGQGVVRVLVNISKCYNPRLNSNPEFWQAIHDQEQ